MLLLIDGYNLLHQSDLLGRGRGDRWLQQARKRLVQRLVQYLDPALAAETCLVFDAAAPPPDLPNSYHVAGIRILYAVGYPEADDLLEELIAQHAAPRRLAVISSDHRVQRAARRRRATAFDADTWYARLIDRGPQLAIPWPAPELSGQHPAASESEKPLTPVDQNAVRQWMQAFHLSPRSTGPPIASAAAAPEPQRASPAATQSERAPPKKIPAKQAQSKQAQSKQAQSKQAQSKRASAEQVGSREVGPQRPPAVNPTPTPPAAPRAKNRPARAADRRPQPSPSADAARRAEQAEESARRPRRQLDPEAGNPFPDGYGEDLLE